MRLPSFAHHHSSRYAPLLICSHRLLTILSSYLPFVMRSKFNRKSNTRLIPKLILCGSLSTSIKQISSIQRTWEPWNWIDWSPSTLGRSLLANWISTESQHTRQRWILKTSNQRRIRSWRRPRSRSQTGGPDHLLIATSRTSITPPFSNGEEGKKVLERLSTLKASIRSGLRIWSIHADYLIAAQHQKEEWGTDLLML